MFPTYKQLLLTIYKSSTCYQLAFASDLSHLLDYLKEHLASRGEKDTVRLIKTLRVIIYQTVSGNQPVVHWMKTDSRRLNLPTVLPLGIRDAIVRRDLESIRYVLSALQISYLITLPLKPALAPIVSQSQADPSLIEEMGAWFRQHRRDTLPSTEEFPDWSKPHRSTSSGPLKGPALWTAPLELSLLSEEMKQNLIILGGEAFEQWFQGCITTESMLIDIKTKVESRMNITPKERKKGESLRRLTSIPAPEGKTRVIAILDYWSQTVLRTLHDWSFDLLAKIPQDMTFNQGNVLQVLRDKPCYYSYDLSSATDRFPITLQESFLAELIGVERARAWSNILIGQPFQADWGPSVKYGAGQPMGAYSSWSIFTLSHHITIAYSACLAGFAPGTFKDYAILGDDLVIAHREVALTYRDVVQRLGVEISEHKSLVSKDTFEFAKRIFHKNVEFTPFPLSSVYQNRRSPSALWSSTLTARERGFRLESACIPGLVAELQFILGSGKRLTRREVKDLESLRCLTHSSEDSAEFMWSLNHISSSLRLPRPCTESISSLKERVASDIVKWTIAYYRQLLHNAMRQYEVISDKILAYGVEGIIDYIPPDCEDPDDPSALPIHPEKLPASWVLINEITTWEADIARLQSVDKRAVFQFLRTFQVTPVADLRRTISRRVNKQATARSSSYIRFLRNESNKSNTRTKDELIS